eukprot:TRINITY_DN10880_c0_g1_i1.p1 TRINITY_DN10880_c0_g1~~TRINITY_DN10880_c0_g1_i1.p1  ORF type:complete len:395 (-),score=70.64 TRINITY_DN10880_c0_g1_i1:67-1206(-)
MTMPQQMRWSLVVMMVALVLSASLLRETEAAKKGGKKSGGTGRYEVVKNRLLDPKGKSFLIRGVSRPSLEWKPDGDSLSQNEIKLMKDKWGFNAVRLTLNQAFWLSDRTSYYPQYKTIIRQYVDWATAEGFVVVLALRYSDQGNTQVSQQCNTKAGDPGCYGQQPLPDSGSLVFWQQVAAEYMNDVNVFFELYSEPFQSGGYTNSFGNNPWGVWRDGGYVSRRISLMGYQAVGMQQIVDGIRATGANNVIIANGLDYGYDLTGIPQYKLSGNNIMYGLHPYDQQTQELSLDRNIGKLMKSYPIIATEFGQRDCNGVDSYVTWLKYAKKHELHWIASFWYGPASTRCSFPPLLFNYVQNNDGLPDPIRGNLVKDALNSKK